MLPRQGDLFANCRILSLCGSGGTGVVYLAQDTLGRTVALKIVPLSDSRRELEGIRRYIQTAENQPHLIRVFHAGIEQECLYYTMEAADNLNESGGPYVPKTLAALLHRDGKMTPRDALDLIRKLIDGLHALHQGDLIHRDIKPENIIFVRGVPKLCDPGLVCAVDATASLVGTLGYLPPECFKGSNINTPNRDLYALGKVFYAAVTGEPPSRYPHIPLDLPFAVRRKLWPVLTRVCNANPKHRFQNTMDFRNALPDELPNPGRWELALNDFRQWRLANPGKMAAFLSGCLLLLALGAAFAYHRVRCQWEHAAFLTECRLRCAEAALRFQGREQPLSDLLADLAGEDASKKVERILKTPPEDPAARLNSFRQLNEELEKLLRESLLPIPEQAPVPEIRKISDRNRGLLASPLGLWITSKEREELLKKLSVLEKQAFSPESSLHPGRTFRTDSSFRCQYIYVPAGVFRRKNGQLVRVPYGFWCSDGELRSDSFLPVMEWLKTGGQPEMPMARFTWNDLLEYCRIMTVSFAGRGMIPQGYIFRPLTVPEWQWACRGAWNGVGNASAFLKNNSGGRLHAVRSGEPNGLGLFDFIGNSGEIVIPESGIEPDQTAAVCGGWYGWPEADHENIRPYLKYQWLPPYIGARIAIVPGSLDFFDRALWLTGPRQTVIDDHRYELIAGNSTHMSRETARRICRLLGGHLLIPESDRQLKALQQAFFETNDFPTVIDGTLKDGVWLRPDGKPFSGMTLPKIPEHASWTLSFQRGKILCYPSPRAAGFICQWSEEEYKQRTDPSRIRQSDAFRHSFRIGSTQYLLVICPVFNHTARRIAQLLGAKLAEPRTQEIRDRIREELKPWKRLPVMLGGHWNFRQWVLSDGTPLAPELPLQGIVHLESKNLAAPGFLDGEFCALQNAQAFLLELPLE